MIGGGEGSCPTGFTNLDGIGENLAAIFVR
jgi:hypothetical protein